MSTTDQFAAIGECMLELAPQPSGANHYQLGIAGDTYNTCVYTRRLTDKRKLQVGYYTAVGEDDFSTQMLEHMQSEAIDTQHITRDAKRRAGLYLIQNQADGERSFCYYREHSAARYALLGDAGQTLLHHFGKANWLYFTGISLAIWQTTPSVSRLQHCLATCHAKGKTIIFDSNYRPGLWQSGAQAQRIYQQFYPYCHLVLSTWEDEHALYADASPIAAIQRIANLGVPRIVLKGGEQGCWCYQHGQLTHVPAKTVAHVVDTTGAGDAFNAGVIAGLYQGDSLVDACQQGHALAAKVIAHRGAIIPPAALAPAHAQPTA